MRPALVSQSPRPVIDGVLRHQNPISATPPATTTAQIAPGWAPTPGTGGVVAGAVGATACGAVPGGGRRSRSPDLCPTRLWGRPAACLGVVCQRPADPSRLLEGASVRGGADHALRSGGSAGGVKVGERVLHPGRWSARAAASASIRAESSSGRCMARPTGERRPTNEGRTVSGTPRVLPDSSQGRGMNCHRGLFRPRRSTGP